MLPNTQKAYDLAWDDVEFLKDMRDAKMFPDPKYFPEDSDKQILAAIYFGWWVGNRGPKSWALRMNEWRAKHE